LDHVWSAARFERPGTKRVRQKSAMAMEEV
jgi:hypothetical protein